jgi:cysteinyl-tRNA synthetase
VRERTSALFSRCVIRRASADVRRALRSQKNFALADEIRDKLKAAGVILEDGPAGTRWRWEG